VSQTELSERLEQRLREAGVAFEVLDHAPARTSEEAARVRVSGATVCRFATMEGSA